MVVESQGHRIAKNALVEKMNGKSEIGGRWPFSQQWCKIGREGIL